jgi:hypothetical protein
MTPTGSRIDPDIVVRFERGLRDLARRPPAAGQARSTRRRQGVAKWWRQHASCSDDRLRSIAVLAAAGKFLIAAMATGRL